MLSTGGKPPRVAWFEPEVKSRGCPSNVMRLAVKSAKLIREHPMHQNGAGKRRNTCFPADFRPMPLMAPIADGIGQRIDS